MNNIIAYDQSSDVRRIIVELRHKASAMVRVDLGYPVGENIVLDASTEVDSSSFLPPHHPDCFTLRTFYDLCDGISLPDVGNGIFIHGRALISTNARRCVPATLRKGGTILVFGTDGGGGMFAMPTDSGSNVIHLPVGAVMNGEFDNIRYPERVIAKSFVEFLSLIVADLDALICDRHDWKFIT